MDNITTTAHVVLQAKGGVGKTYVSSLIAQHYGRNSRNVVCVDTDSANRTFASYKSLGVRSLELTENGDFDQSRFDLLVEWMCNNDKDLDFVIDTGSNIYSAIANYIIEGGIVDLLNSMGRETIIHSVLVGGPDQLNTIRGLDALASSMPEPAKIVVWLNEFNGSVKHEDKTFEEMKVYKKHKERIHSIIRLPFQTQSTFGKNVREMMRLRLTFNEAQHSSEFMIAEKQRLSMISKGIFEQLNHLIPLGSL